MVAMGDADQQPVRKHPMPGIAAFVAQLRAAFGDATIDETLARGKASEPTFFARENGWTVGTKAAVWENSWKAGDGVRNPHYCNGCDGACVGTDTRCSQRR